MIEPYEEWMSEPESKWTPLSRWLYDYWPWPVGIVFLIAIGYFLANLNPGA